MKNILVAGLTALSVLLAPVALDKFVRQHAMQTVHRISNEYGNGSGVMIAPNLMLTASHVAENRDLMVNGQPIQVLAQDEELDLALIHVKQDCPCASIAGEVSVGESIYVVGNPIQKGIGGQVLTTGEVLNNYVLDRRMITDAAAAPGNSGGGVFNKYGKLVAILVEGVSSNAGFYPIPIFNLNRSVDLPSIKYFLYKNGIDV